VSDLTAAEQTNVRTALKFLRTRCGSWTVLSRALGFGESTIGNVVTGFRPVSPVVAFRVAKLAKVGVDDVLQGRYPEPGTCPHCGHVSREAAQ